MGSEDDGTAQESGACWLMARRTWWCFCKFCEWENLRYGGRAANYWTHRSAWIRVRAEQLLKAPVDGGLDLRGARQKPPR
jgi:hypothetical protein